MKTLEEFKKLVVDALEMQTELDYVITHELGTAEARQNLKSAGEEVMDAYKEALDENLRGVQEVGSHLRRGNSRCS